MLFSFGDILTPAFFSLLEILETMLELDAEVDDNFDVEDKDDFGDVKVVADDDVCLLDMVDECAEVDFNGFNEVE